MKTERVEYRKSSFIDYTGNKREYIVAAVSKVIGNKKDGGYVVLNDDDISNLNNSLSYDGKDYLFSYGDYRAIVYKLLSLGFAICRAGDTFNEEIGKEIAYGRAIKKPQRQIFADDLGLINTKVVNAVLEQEMEYFEANPGSIITGYNHDAEKYKKEHSTNVEEIIEILDKRGLKEIK